MRSTPSSAMTAANATMSATYNRTGFAQFSAHDVSHPMLLEQAQKLVSRFPPRDRVYHFADLGCSQGLNSVQTLGLLVDTIRGYDESSEFIVYHEDLPTNDFNQLIMTLEASKDHYLKPGVYGCAVGRSLYERLFPSDFVHMITCHITLHWLSRSPGLLRGITFNPLEQTADPDEVRVWKAQADSDLSLFLRLRAPELKSGGEILCVMVGARDDGTTSNPYVRYQGQDGPQPCAISRTLRRLVDMGIIDKGDAERAQAPYYFRTCEEVERVVTTDEALREAYKVHSVEHFEVPLGGPPSEPLETRVDAVADLFWGIHENCVTEPLLGNKTEEEKSDLTETLKKIYKEELREEYIGSEKGPTMDVIMLAAQRK